MLPVQQIVRVEADEVAVIDVVAPLVVNVVDDKITDKVAVDNHQTDEDTKFLQSRAHLECTPSNLECTLTHLLLILLQTAHFDVHD